MDEKNFEKIKLLLKNAKINLLLADNNLKYVKSSNLECNTKINNEMIKIRYLEDSVENYIIWITNENEEFNYVEMQNNALVQELINRTEKVSSKIEFENKTNDVNIENINLSINKTSNMNSRSRIQSNKNVGGLILQAGLAFATAAYTALTNKKSNNSNANYNYPTVHRHNTRTYDDYRRNYGTTTSNQNSQNAWLKKLLNATTQIVENFSSKVTKYLEKTKNAKTLKEQAADLPPSEIGPLSGEYELIDLPLNVGKNPYDVDWIGGFKKIGFAGLTFGTSVASSALKGIEIRRRYSSFTWRQFIQYASCRS